MIEFIIYFIILGICLQVFFSIVGLIIGAVGLVIKFLYEGIFHLFDGM